MKIGAKVLIPRELAKRERIKKNSDGTEGNINVSFNKLHPDWKKENLAAGRAALEAVTKFPHDDEAAADYIHKEWMKRNPKAEWNAAQHVPFKQLSKEEADKDRAQVKIMRRLLAKHNKLQEGEDRVPPRPEPGLHNRHMAWDIKYGHDYNRDGTRKKN